MRCGAMQCTITWQCDAVMPFCGWFWCSFYDLCSLMNTPRSKAKWINDSASSKTIRKFSSKLQSFDTITRSPDWGSWAQIPGLKDGFTTTRKPKSYSSSPINPGRHTIMLHKDKDCLQSRRTFWPLIGQDNCQVLKHLIITGSIF